MRAADHPFIAACLASALVFVAMFDGTMVVTRLQENQPVLWLPILKVGVIGFGLCTLAQLCFGGVLYTVLRWLGLFRWWTVLPTYLLPVALFAVLAETTSDIQGAKRWALYMSITALVFWYVANHAAGGRRGQGLRVG